MSNGSVWALMSPTMTSVTSAVGIPLHLRIYGYSGSGSAGSGSINWKIDDLVLTISVNAASGTPYLAVNPWTLSGFQYVYGSGPSANQTYTLTGSYLDGSTVTDRKSTRLNSSHLGISYAVFCLKKKKISH